MSLRTMKKMFGPPNTLPPLEGNSDEEFEPLYAKETKSKFSYEGLDLGSQAESEQENSEAADDEQSNVQKQTKKQTAKARNKKKQRRQKKAASIDPIGPELDEIDQSVLEVNALLGEPSSNNKAATEEKSQDPRKMLLSVQAKHLDFNNELKRVFGSDAIDENGRGKKYRPHNVVKYRRGAIVSISDKQFHSVGLSMSLQRRENGLSYFTFDHNREYQKMHKHFLEVLSHDEMVPLDDSRKNMHIEGLLESTDIMFRAEEYTAANNFLELIISYMHYVAHPAFNLTDQSVRLEYKYMENRPFFVAVLKYMHMLSNKACHRTALELAKLLLNLEPADPLAIIYVVDVLALRARAHRWLVDAADYWGRERDASYLFNMQYSYALAHFHLAKKDNKNEFERADKLLQDAMLLYPTLTARIFENCKHDASHQICAHPYFDLAAEAKFPDKIKTIMILHAKLVCWRWREPPVMEWFFRNAKEVVAKLDGDPEYKKIAAEMKVKRHNLLAGCPDELHRHLQAVKSMTNLLVEWELPAMSRQRSWDPVPPAKGVNRYSYGFASELDSRYYSGLLNIFSLV